jgi:hypothetical protein
MNDSQLTPEEQTLITQLRSVRKHKIDPAVREAIRAQMLGEFRAIVQSGQLPSTPTTGLTSFPFYVIAGLVAVVAIVIIGLAVINRPSENNATPTTALSPTQQVVVVPTSTPETILANETPTIEVTPTIAPIVTTELIASTPPMIVTTTPEPTLETVVVVEGPVSEIADNRVTIYDYSIAVEPQHPILNLINVGDVVRIEGMFDSSGVVVASVVSNIPSTNVVSGGEATVGLEGPVEAIDGNVIVVNSIPVQLTPDDPLLQTLEVGDFVSVQGNFQGSGATIVLVVVNITIVNNVIIDDNPLCWYHDDGMGMGHWHCDGMGMGGMGMGDDGMGGMGMGQ